MASHAEGEMSKADRYASHAEGIGTIAHTTGQHVEGKYNIEDTGHKYVHIVGNGTSNEERSNAHTLDWEGNAWFAGNVTVGPNKSKLLSEADITSKGYVTLEELSTNYVSKEEFNTLLSQIEDILSRI